MKIVYDPLTEGSAMPLEAIQGQPTPFWLLYALALTCGGSLITMGLVRACHGVACALGRSMCGQLCHAQRERTQR